MIDFYLQLVKFTIMNNICGNFYHQMKENKISLKNTLRTNNKRWHFNDKSSPSVITYKKLWLYNEITTPECDKGLCACVNWGYWLGHWNVILYCTNKVFIIQQLYFLSFGERVKCHFITFVNCKTFVVML